MPKQLTCDICGSDNDVGEDYDGDILCSYHQTEKKIKELERTYTSKLNWVKKCWVSELIKMRKDIKRLKEFNKTREEAIVNISGRKDQ